MDEQAWQAKSVEILTEIKAWRQAHPTATFVEIEEQVHACLMELEAHVLQDAASASERRAWGQSTDTPAPLCPTCAVPLQARGKQERTLGIAYFRGHRRHRGGASGHGLARPYGVRLCRSPRGVGPNTSLDIHPPGRQSKPTIIRATKLHNASVIRSAFVDVRGTWQGQ